MKNEENNFIMYTTDDGKIEKNPATRNLNKANTGYQWSSTSGSGSIASGDRGLGLEE